LALRGARLEEKIGFPSQPLEAHVGGAHGFRLLPVQHDGQEDATKPSTEAGLYTQVHFGASAWAMTELEQLSPRLRETPGSTAVDTTVRVEFISRGCE
jgi:hypothetical protein